MNKKNVFTSVDKSVFSDEKTVFKANRQDVFTNPISTKSSVRSDIRNDNVGSVKARISKKDNFVRYGKDDNSSNEKIAIRKVHSSQGGGATFKFKYDNDGKLNANVSLDRGLFRNKDNSGVITKAGILADKVEKTADFFTSDGNESANGEVYSKVEKFVGYSQVAHRRDKNRYKRISKEAKKETKQLKKEIKAQSIANRQVNATTKPTERGYSDRNVGSFSSYTPDYAKGIGNSNFNGLYDRSAVNSQIISDIPGNNFLEGDKSGTYVSHRQEFTHTHGHEPRINNKRSEQRLMTKEEQLEQSIVKKKEARKEQKKQAKKAAVAASVKNLSNANKKLSNEVGNLDFQSSGDLLKDGASGLVSTFTDMGKNFVKSLGQDFMKFIFRSIKRGLFGLISVIWMPVVAVLGVALIAYEASSFMSGILVSTLGDDNDYEITGHNSTYDVEVEGDGLYRGTRLSNDYINSIIDSLYENYSDFSSSQESVIRYGLSTVGCAYSQSSHWNHNDDIYDCSELAYLSYLSAGISIDNNGYYSAAEECKALEQAGYDISGDMKPGDIIFYGNSNNGRYKGIYHVSIYIGNIDGVDKVFQAYGKNKGVIMSDVNTNNIVSICRPI